MVKYKAYSKVNIESELVKQTDKTIGARLAFCLGMSMLAVRIISVKY